MPYWSSDGANYFRVGISDRYVGADAGTLRFRGRPESNVTSYYVDSRSMTANHANEVSVESLWSRGAFSKGGDAARASVDAQDFGNPQFRGAYVVASYVLTGEQRPYDKMVGYPSGGPGNSSGDTPTSTSLTRRLTAACLTAKPSA